MLKKKLIFAATTASAAVATYSHQAEFSGEIVYIDLLAKTNDLLDFLFYKPLNLSLLPH